MVQSKWNNRCYEKWQTSTIYWRSICIKRAYKLQIKSEFFTKKHFVGLPVGRGDYWILKLDENYQVALIGTPNKKYLVVNNDLNSLIQPRLKNI